MAKQKRWTKRCKQGKNCVGAGSLGEPVFVPDDVEVCDNCLLSSFSTLGFNYKFDGCGDPLSMYPLYDRDDVIVALREAYKRWA